MLIEHVDEPVLEGDDAVPLGPVDPLAGLLVDVGLVGGDAQVRDAPAAGEVVDGDVGAEAADDFRAIESEGHGDSPMVSMMTMGCEPEGPGLTPPGPFPLTLFKPFSTSGPPGPRARDSAGPGRRPARPEPRGCRARGR